MNPRGQSNQVPITTGGRKLPNPSFAAVRTQLGVLREAVSTGISRGRLLAETDRRLQHVAYLLSQLDRLNDLLLARIETGGLDITPNPDGSISVFNGSKEVSRFTPVPGKVWNPVPTGIGAIVTYAPGAPDSGLAPEQELTLEIQLESLYYECDRVLDLLQHLTGKQPKKCGVRLVRNQLLAHSHDYETFYTIGATTNGLVVRPIVTPDRRKAISDRGTSANIHEFEALCLWMLGLGPRPPS